MIREFMRSVRKMILSLGDEDAEEQKETPVPKTGDSMTMELMLFAVLAAGAAFGMKKAYNKTK